MKGQIPLIPIILLINYFSDVQCNFFFQHQSKFPKYFQTEKRLKFLPLGRGLSMFDIFWSSRSTSRWMTGIVDSTSVKTSWPLKLVESEDRLPPKGDKKDEWLLPKLVESGDRISAKLLFFGEDLLVPRPCCWWLLLSNRLRRRLSLKKKIGIQMLRLLTTYLRILGQWQKKFKVSFHLRIWNVLKAKVMLKMSLKTI